MGKTFAEKMLGKKWARRWSPARWSLPEAVIGIFNDGGLIPHTRKVLGTER